VSTRIDQPLVHGGSQPGYNMLSSAPGPLVRAGDFLRLNATTTNATGVLALNGRLLTLGGDVVPFALSLTFSGTGNQAAVATPLADGWIIGFNVFVSSGAIMDGEVRAAVEVVQGTGTAATRVMSLASGAVTNIRGLGLGAYTSVDIAYPTTVFTGSDPAAGVEIAETIPAGAAWRIQSILTTLVTSATVASRVTQLTVTRSGVVIFRSLINGSMSASTTTAIIFSPFGASFSSGGVIVAGLLIPDLILNAGDVIATITASLQVGDNYAAPVIVYS